MNLGTRAARLLPLPDIGWGIPRIASEYTPGIAPARARTGDACGIPRVIHTVFGLWDARGMSWRHRWILGGWKRRHSAPDWQIVCWNKQAAVAGHPLLGAIIALLRQRSVLDIHTDYDESEASRLFQHLTFGSWRSASA